MFVSLILAAVLSQTAPDAAAALPATATPQAAPLVTADLSPPSPTTTAAQNRRVCRNEAVVGTRMSSRICMTQHEWDNRRDNSRALAHRLEGQNANRGRVYAPGR